MNGDDLDTKKQQILKTVAEVDTPTTPTLKQHDDLEDLYSHSNSINRALNQLEELNYLESEPGNPKTWALSDKGQREVKKLKQATTDGTGLYGDAEAEEVFRDFFEHVAEEELIDVQIGRDHIYVDYEDLERFDSKLADELIVNPEEMLDKCESALNEYLGVDRNVEVRIKNIPEIYHKSISELSADDLDRLVTVKGVIQSSSDKKFQLTDAVFECMACENVYRRKQSGKLKKPYKCGKCDNKEFEVLETERQSLRYLHIKEQPGKKDRDKMVVVVRGDLADDESKNLKATGSGITVTGYVEPYKPKKTADAEDMRLVANNVEIQEDKWEDIEIDSDDRQQIRAIAERDDNQELLVRSLAADRVKHMELVKQAALVWLLGRTQEGNVHVLVFGEPGTGKSEVGRYIQQEFPKVLWSVGQGSSGVGLTASVTKDKLTGEWVAEAGKLAMADGGYHITDEFDKMTDSNDVSNMNDALSEGIISLDKANIHTELSADVSEFAIANPDGSSLIKEEEAWKQIPIDDSKSDLKDRFDLFVCVKGNDLGVEEQLEQEREIIRHMIRRNHFETADESDHQDEADIIDKDLLIKYIAFAQRLSPELSEDAADKLESVYFNINLSGDAGRSNLWGRRRLMTLLKVAIAFARMDLSPQVEEDHVEAANKFVRKCFASMDFEIGKDSPEDLGSAKQDQRTAVKTAIQNVADDDGLAPIDDVIEAANLSEDTVEEIIETLMQEGEVFEPQNGHLKLV